MKETGLYPWADQQSARHLEDLGAASDNWEIEQACDGILASAYDYAVLDVISQAPRREHADDRQVALHIVFKALSSAFENDAGKKFFVRRALINLVGLDGGADPNPILAHPVKFQGGSFSLEADKSLVLDSIYKYFPDDSLDTVITARDRNHMHGLNTSLEAALAADEIKSEEPETIEQLIFDLEQISSYLVDKYANESGIAARCIKNNLREHRDCLRNYGTQAIIHTREVLDLANIGDGTAARIYIEENIVSDRQRDMIDDFHTLLEAQLAYRATIMINSASSAKEVEQIVDFTASITEDTRQLPLRAIHHQVIELALSMARSNNTEEAKQCLEAISDVDFAADFSTILDNEVLHTALTIEKNEGHRGLAKALAFLHKFASIERANLMMRFLAQIPDGAK